jgi:hypothetical protein
MSTEQLAMYVTAAAVAAADVPMKMPVYRYCYC